MLGGERPHETSNGCPLIRESSPRQGIQSSTRPCCHEWRHVGSTARRYQHGGLTEYEHGNYAYGHVERRKRHHLVMPHQPFAEAKGKQRADYRAAGGDKQVLDLEVTQYVDLSCTNCPPYSNLPGPLTYPQTGQTDDTRGGHAQQNEANDAHQHCDAALMAKMARAQLGKRMDTGAVGHVAHRVHCKKCLVDLLDRLCRAVGAHARHIARP